jgi:hypothetical protein
MRRAANAYFQATFVTVSTCFAALNVARRFGFHGFPPRNLFHREGLQAECHLYRFEVDLVENLQILARSKEVDMATQTSQQNDNNKGKASKKTTGRQTQKPASSDTMLATDIGAPDEQYALTSVIYHSLKGAETAAKYAEDAKRANDDELLEFFADLREEYAVRAGRARALLIERAADADDLDDDDDESESDENE